MRRSALGRLQSEVQFLDTREVLRLKLLRGHRGGGGGGEGWGRAVASPLIPAGCRLTTD